MSKFLLAALVASALVAAAFAVSHEEAHRRLANCHTRGAACESHDHQCHHDASVCYMSVGEAIDEPHGIHEQYAAVHAMGCRAAHWIAAGKPMEKPADMAHCMMPDPRILLDLDAEAGRRLSAVVASVVVEDCNNFDDDSDTFHFLGSDRGAWRPNKDSAYSDGEGPAPARMVDDDSFKMHATGDGHVMFKGDLLTPVVDAEGHPAVVAVTFDEPTDDYYCVFDFGDPHGNYGVTVDVRGHLKYATTDDDGNFFALFVINYETGEWERVFVTGDDDSIDLDLEVYAEPGEFVRWIHYTDDDEQFIAHAFVEFGDPNFEQPTCDAANPVSNVEYLADVKQYVTTDNLGGEPDYRFGGIDYWKLDNPLNYRNLARCGGDGETADE